MKTVLTVIIFSLLSFLSVGVSAQSNTEVSTMLWKGVGGKTKWDSTNYILFTAYGNDAKHLQGDRKYLINKRSGQARFEGKTEDGNNIVALFNFKTDKLTKFFTNGGEVKPLNADVIAIFAKIKEQFRKDAALIFLPTLIDKPDTKTGKVSSKIVNAEKLQSLPFQLKDSILSGELFFHGETGYIKQVVDRDGNTYFVNGYKDIGGGLILPTTFKNMDNQARSTLFTTVAAFTDMEESKFSNL